MLNQNAENCITFNSTLLLQVTGLNKLYSALTHMTDIRGYWHSLHISLTARCLLRVMVTVNLFYYDAGSLLCALNNGKRNPFHSTFPYKVLIQDIWVQRCLQKKQQHIEWVRNGSPLAGIIFFDQKRWWRLFIRNEQKVQLNDQFVIFIYLFFSAWLPPAPQGLCDDKLMVHLVVSGSDTCSFEGKFSLILWRQRIDKRPG